jgi:hypothetical protein
MQKTCHPRSFRLKVRLRHRTLFPNNKEVTSLYPQLLTYLMEFIKYQDQVIRTLLTLLIGKSMFKKTEETPVYKPYRKLQVDDLPIIETLQKFDYRCLLTEYLEKNGKHLKPVQRRSNAKTAVSKSMNCPKRGAPSDYLYANNGGKGQYQCKVCACLFNDKSRYLKEAILKCPHCSKTLEKVKERKDFDVYKCKNNDCSYYQKKLNGMSSKEKKQFKKDPQLLNYDTFFASFTLIFSHYLSLRLKSQR